jgi:hypothetical protein
MMKHIQDLPPEIIWEIFDQDPEAGYQLAKTNRWFYDVLEDKIIEHRKLVKEANAVASHWLEVSCEDFESLDNVYHQSNILSVIKTEVKKLMDENNREFYFYCNQCFKPMCENMKEVYKDEYTRNINIKRIYNGIYICDICKLYDDSSDSGSDTDDDYEEREIYHMPYIRIFN